MRARYSPRVTSLAECRSEDGLRVRRQGDRGLAAERRFGHPGECNEVMWRCGMTERTTRTEARNAIRDVLLQWRDDGVEHPVIAVCSANRALPRFYGLDDDGHIVLVEGSVDESVSAPTGEGLEVSGSDSPRDTALLGDDDRFVF